MITFDHISHMPPVTRRIEYELNTRPGPCFNGQSYAVWLGLPCYDNWAAGSNALVDTVSMAFLKHDLVAGRG